MTQTRTRPPRRKPPAKPPESGPLELSSNLKDEVFNPPKPCEFTYFDSLEQGIAKSRSPYSGLIRVEWTDGKGEEHECSVPEGKVNYLLAPTIESTAEPGGELATKQESTLDRLVSEINLSHAQIQEAIAVATSASKSALEHARRCGELLLEAKAIAGHGNWQNWRNQNIPELTSSTAALYQRIFENWDEIQNQRIETVRDADRALRAAKEDKADGDENYSPTELMELVRKVLGQIDLDVASCELANATVKAVQFYDKKLNGLIQRWFGRVWMNPPYSSPLIKQFVEKLLQEWGTGNIEAAIVITNNCTDAAWFQSLASACTVRLDCRGRWQFYNPDREYTGGNRQGQTIFYFGPTPELFYAAFAGKGIFYPAPPDSKIQRVAILPEPNKAESPIASPATPVPSATYTPVIEPPPTPTLDFPQVQELAKDASELVFRRLLQVPVEWRLELAEQLEEVVAGAIEEWAESHNLLPEEDS